MITKSIAVILFTMSAVVAQGLETRTCHNPNTTDHGDISFVANKGDGVYSDSGDFCYSEGFGGPTGDGTDWFGGMEGGEKIRIRNIASKCGMNLPEDRANWFSAGNNELGKKNGVDCILDDIIARCLQKFPNGGRIEIDNTNWWAETSGGGHSGQHLELYKVIAKKLAERKSCFTVVPKNLSDQELSQLASFRSSDSSGGWIDRAAIQEGNEQGCFSSKSGAGGFNIYKSKDTFNYTLSGSCGSSDDRGLASGADSNFAQ